MNRFQLVLLLRSRNQLVLRALLAALARFFFSARRVRQLLTEIQLGRSSTGFLLNISWKEKSKVSTFFACCFAREFCEWRDQSFFRLNYSAGRLLPRSIFPSGGKNQKCLREKFFGKKRIRDSS